MCVIRSTEEGIEQITFRPVTLTLLPVIIPPSPFPSRIVRSSPELLLMEPIVLQGCLSRMAEEVFDGNEVSASALFVRQPVLLAQSHRLQPLVRLMVEELKATLPEVCVDAWVVLCVAWGPTKVAPFERCYTTSSDGTRQPLRVKGYKHAGVVGIGASGAKYWLVCHGLCPESKELGCL